MVVSSISTSEYNSYYANYLGLVGNDKLMNALERTMSETAQFFEQLPEDKWTYRYEVGKWTPKDILMHIADTERVFAYRALFIARCTDSKLQGFDENIFARTAMANELSVENLLLNFKAVRLSTINLFRDLNDTQLRQLGQANGHTLSVRAAGFIICGHEIHHRNIISERYL